jgi:hypothetical protein
MTRGLRGIDPYSLDLWRTAMTSNIEATKNGYECFQRGDIPALIRDLLDDNCTWVTPGPKDKLPWAGTFKGKQEIANFFARVGQTLEFSEFAPREMISREIPW